METLPITDRDPGDEQPEKPKAQELTPAQLEEDRDLILSVMSITD